jgi:predicted GNAT family N-acyltransferase
MDIRRVDFDENLAEIRGVRFSVFVDEQHVPAEIEMDDRDAVCIHVLATDRAVSVGTGRIDIANAGKVGRVAVLGTRRGEGIGTAIMERLHQIAAGSGLASVWCHAQVSAVPFYASLGYRITSEPFYEADIEHVRMECDISARSDRR